VLSAFEDIDTTQVWDGHVHLLGLGDTDSGAWVNPISRNLLHPWRYLQFQLYLNAACLPTQQTTDEGYVMRLSQLQWGRGSRLLLLALDYTYNEKGERLPEKSAFYTPNAYAARIHQQFPEIFEWVASIHPYRPDCVEALEQAFAQGARGVKWLPPAMGMNPASPLCDRFYETIQRLGIPLLCHGGSERAVGGSNTQAYGNPLALRRALERGVKVVVAHCASQGHSVDTDRGNNAPMIRNFDLFARLMDEKQYEGVLFGDISALSQLKRVEPYLGPVLKRQAWHPRLIYGSDYPLPGVIPLVSLKKMVHENYLTATQADVLAKIRQHNVLLFDFILNRQVRFQGHRFDTPVFHTRSLWTGTRRAAV
jgi:mannonate dehydratase